MIVQHTVVKTPNFTNLNKNHFFPKYKNAYFSMSFPVRKIEKSRFFFPPGTLPKHFAKIRTLPMHFARHFAKALCQGSTLQMHALCQGTLSKHFAKTALCHSRQANTLLKTGMHALSQYQPLCQALCQALCQGMQAGTLPGQADMHFARTLL